MIYHKIKDNVAKGLLQYGFDEIILGLSGGPDSMLLFHIFIELCPRDLVCVHFNYQQRGIESDAEEELVRQACITYGIKLYVEHWDQSAFAKMTGNFQERARKARYQLMKNLRSTDKKSILVTGHHLHDQLEGHLMALGRGAGLKGLKGMPKYSAELWRPLLPFSKDQILQAIDEKKISFLIDSSNLQKVYRRNALRAQVIPALTETNSRFMHNFLISNQHLQEIWFALEEAALDMDLDSACRPHSNLEWLILKIRLLNLGFSGEQIDDIRQRVDTTEAKYFYCQGHKVVVSRGDIHISETEVVESETYSFEMRKGLYRVNEVYQLRVEICRLESVRFATNCILLRHEYLGEKFEIKSPNKSDRIELFGQPGKHKKVQDIVTDKKMDILTQKSMKGLYYKEEIFWLIGLKVSQKTYVHENEKKCFLLTWERVSKQ